jgi:hypothetical protein
MLLLFSNACLADEILKRDQVEVPVEEYLDGVATGKQSLLSFVIKSDRKDVRWDICMIGFEANNSKKNVRATVYRIANSSDRPSIPDEPMTKLLVWTPHKEAKFEVVDLANVKVFIGSFLGAMTVFFFTSLTIRAVGKAAGVIVEEVRRQFREKKGIMAGTEDPDYAAAVDIATKSALREMILPGIVAVVAPVVVGLAFGKEAVAGLLMVGTIVGVLMAAYLNNAGGAWDNAKKYIEMGAHGGKRSPAHQAAVTGDTVGDPFKDTAGPSLHVLIKLFATLTLALAALFM